MSRLGKTWCDACKKDTHNTKDCWGPGTVAVGVPYYDPMAGKSLAEVMPPGACGALADRLFKEYVRSRIVKPRTPTA